MKSQKENFLDILTNYQGILHKVSWVYFKNKTDREDNIQEIIYQLWKSYPTIKNHKSIGSWIYAVSINISLSRIKKESRGYSGSFCASDFGGLVPGISVQTVPIFTV